MKKILLIITFLFSFPVMSGQVPPVDGGEAYKVYILSNTSYKTFDAVIQAHLASGSLCASVGEPYNSCEETSGTRTESSNAWQYKYTYCYGTNCGYDSGPVQGSIGTETEKICPASHPVQIWSGANLSACEDKDCSDKAGQPHSNRMYVPAGNFPTASCKGYCAITVDDSEYIGYNGIFYIFQYSGTYTGESCTTPADYDRGGNYGDYSPYNRDCDDPNDPQCQYDPTPEDDPAPNGGNDENADTDPLPGDEDGDGDDGDDLDKARNKILSEIEDNSDDLEGLINKGNNDRKKQLSNSATANKWLSKIHKTLEEIKKQGPGQGGDGGAGGGDGNGNGEGDCPEDSKDLCAIQDMLEGEGNETEYEQVGELDVEKVEDAPSSLRYGIEIGQGSCPVSPQISALGRTITIDLSIFCSIAVFIKTLVIISAWLTAVRIYGSIN